ncbi:OTU domain-containing protein 1-like [Stylophora pistillata]|uniref:OTU domain-containing protein 1-like n=1 Tax=Stylophora pistillata TaxID=50429 RepID=UPI000C055664|nr:OTU domain-containing protein 1-like [Stylophora pistillata]
MRNTIHSISFDNADFVLHYRMLRYGLRPLDVGGGDCLFKSISHQLYGDSSHHAEIRALEVTYLIENPEQFLESVEDTPWVQYLSDMSKQGTWADNIIIQAVADAINLKIHIIKSSQNFREITLIEPAQSNLLQNRRSIFIGHIGEMHYVLTCSTDSSNDINDDSNKVNEKLDNRRSKRQQKADYMKQYRISTASPEKRAKINAGPEKKAKRNEYERNHRASLASPENKAKRNEYEQNHSATLASPEKKAKHNEYEQNRRL